MNQTILADFAKKFPDSIKPEHLSAARQLQDEYDVLFRQKEYVVKGSFEKHVNAARTAYLADHSDANLQKLIDAVTIRNVLKEDRSVRDIVRDAHSEFGKRLKSWVMSIVTPAQAAARGEVERISRQESERVRQLTGRDMKHPSDVVSPAAEAFAELQNLATQCASGSPVPFSPAEVLLAFGVSLDTGLKKKKTA